MSDRADDKRGIRAKIDRKNAQSHDPLWSDDAQVLVQREKEEPEECPRVPFCLHVGHIADNHLAIDETETRAKEHHRERGVLPGPLCAVEGNPDC